MWHLSFISFFSKYRSKNITKYLIPISDLDRGGEMHFSRNFVYRDVFHMTKLTHPVWAEAEQIERKNVYLLVR